MKSWHSTGSRGFTLLELIMVTAMIVVMVGAVHFIFGVQLNALRQGFTRINMRQEINHVMQRMISEIRGAIEYTVSATTITFKADLDPNINNQENYRYTLANNQLSWELTSPSPTPSIVLINHIDLPPSNFFLNNNLITIQLQTTNNNQTMNLQNTVRIRNF